MSVKVAVEPNGVTIETLEMLLHVLAHEIESQAYLQMAVRVADDPALKAFLIDMLGEEQLHEKQIRAKLRDKYRLDI
ncbi:MAG TPA: hypothetical protein VHS28_00455 [Chloroflexota bacterium]|nr:hypothetical protein [Chloroflexota bacterium]